MSFCKHRVLDICDKDDRPCIFSEDCFEPEDEKPMTNGDRIRAMSDEELVNIVPCPLGFSMFRCPIDRKCGDCKRDWLQQPAED